MAVLKEDTQWEVSNLRDMVVDNSNIRWVVKIHMLNQLTDSNQLTQEIKEGNQLHGIKTNNRQIHMANQLTGNNQLMVNQRMDSNDLF